MLLCLACRVSAFEQEIVLGRGDEWRDLTALETLTLIPGKWGYPDVVLKDAELAATRSTDLLLHLNQRPFRDEVSHYDLHSDEALLSDDVHVFGRGSAAFVGGPNGLVLAPREGALFARETRWEDFSIGFWLNPALLEDGEAILTWQGSRWNQAEIVSQALGCHVRDRALVWTFENFFVPLDGRPHRLQLTGITRLLPHQWRHHLVRFDMHEGLLEYLIDGIPEAMAYVTTTGRDGGTVFTPFVGSSAEGAFALGQGFAGFVDEFFLLRQFEDRLRLTKYAGKTGIGVSRVFDLGYSETRLKRIDPTFSTPGDSDVHFYFRVADRLATSDSLASEWVQAIPGADILDAHGRYLQLRIELFPDGSHESSPLVSQIVVAYEPDLPPGAPSGLRALPADNSITLIWDAVNESDVKGYLLSYGESPGHYLGTGSDQGNSPIDVGNRTVFELTGLENGKLYYFVVAAYDASYPPETGEFSDEVGVRPSRVR